MTGERQDTIVTAAFLVIGDEILSGRTKDKNIGYLAEYLTALGIDLAEVRVVPDVTERIVEAVNALRARYTYVFTSGGIGPTHDDITADSIAAAFDVPIDHDPRAVAILKAFYPEGQLTQARLRMARIPQGAELIENTVSKAPGFRIGNVHVMAGVPAIMQAMLDAIAPTLKTGTRILSRAIDADLPESRIADRLRTIQDENPGTMIGSYPRSNDGRFSTQIVVRSRDEALLERAASAVSEAVAETTRQAPNP
ncbi:competence/damage-inducible protein A [Stappia sp.]|jgi:molybdenum cofactor synthesis domain-containing protein|uniref:competence/damage-inducible protein A n=1 Tax=Stappia sp. TaxID=1870903 RepID=UPI003A9A4F52